METINAKGNHGPSKLYRTSSKDCKVCPLKQSCIGKQHQKRISITCFRDEYERAIARVHTRWGRRMKRLRQAIVELVLDTLLNYMALRKVNTRGLVLAHKCMLLVAMAYNLQKLLRFTPKKARQLSWPCPERSKGRFCGCFLWEGKRES